MNWATLINSGVNQYEGAVNDITNPISASSVADREYNAMREDTQYQRLRQDLSAAGLNKWLAVNGAAQPSSQAISQTSEAASRSRELGFKYQELLANVMEFASKQITDKAQKNVDNVWNFAGKVVGGLVSGLF